MPLLATLLIGFSFLAALLLIVVKALQAREEADYVSKFAGFALIMSLVVIQGLNLHFILAPVAQDYSLLYTACLYSIAPCFYLYSQQLLTIDHPYHRGHLLHLVPLIISLPLPTSTAVPLAFLIGSAYLVSLAKTVYSLRQQRQRFKQELFVLAIFSLLAIGIVLLGFIWPLLSKITFITGYSLLISSAFFITLFILIRFPTLTEDISEAIQSAYTVSSLTQIDCQKVMANLATLMTEDKLYTHEHLSLASLAEQLHLTSHQLSELINTEFQQGFSKYIRQHRVDAAKKLLLTEPNASVLSIGLSVGFSTQSNFYTAFRDITGLPPGKYRTTYLSI